VADVEEHHSEPLCIGREKVVDDFRTRDVSQACDRLPEQGNVPEPQEVAADQGEAVRGQRFDGAARLGLGSDLRAGRYELAAGRRDHREAIGKLAHLSERRFESLTRL
jgi:hypothetical protein